MPTLDAGNLTNLRTHPIGLVVATMMAGHAKRDNIERKVVIGVMIVFSLSAAVGAFLGGDAGETPGNDSSGDSAQGFVTVGILFAVAMRGVFAFLGSPEAPIIFLAFWGSGPTTLTLLFFCGCVKATFSFPAFLGCSVAPLGFSAFWGSFVCTAAAFALRVQVVLHEFIPIELADRLIMSTLTTSLFSHHTLLKGAAPAGECGLLLEQTVPTRATCRKKKRIPNGLLKRLNYTTIGGYCQCPL